MEDFEETFNYDYDDTSLTMFLFYILKKLDVSTKRDFLAMFLEGIMGKDERSPFDPATIHVSIQLSKECKSRVRQLLDHADIIFYQTLSKKQKELYSYFSEIKMFMEHGMTDVGYIEFLNACGSLVKITDLPFSLEEDYGGLKTWEAWNTAIEKAIEDCKLKFDKKRKKK